MTDIIDIYRQAIRLPLTDVKTLETLLANHRYKEEFKQEKQLQQQIEALQCSMCREVKELYEYKEENCSPTYLCVNCCEVKQNENK